MIVNHDITGTAFIRAAAKMGASQAKLAAQKIEQGLIRCRIDRCLDAIEAESNGRHCRLMPPKFVECLDDDCAFDSVAAQLAGNVAAR